jgi:hypothetical protein
MACAAGINPVVDNIAHFKVLPYGFNLANGKHDVTG